MAEPAQDLPGRRGDTAGGGGAKTGTGAARTRKSARARNTTAATEAAVAAKKTAKTKRNPAKPKRQYRYRKACPAAVMERVPVATKPHYMTLLHREPFAADAPHRHQRFSVFFLDSVVYNVDVAAVPSCDCYVYNWAQRQDRAVATREEPCIHIIFVFLKVLKVDIASPHWYQRALLPSELNDIFAGAPATLPATVNAEFFAHSAFMKAIGRTSKDDKDGQGCDPDYGKHMSALGDDCPVCHEEMTEEDNAEGRLTFHLGLFSCGRPLHSECLSSWKAARASQLLAVTCVSCNGYWIEPTADQTLYRHFELKHDTLTKTDRWHYVW